MRQNIRDEVSGISPLDEVETKVQHDALLWIDSGQELCRTAKPDVPPKHLVSYFVVVDGDYVLLVDHINAQLWLPTGGHVEPGEHPRDAALREAREELSIEAAFLMDGPQFITAAETVGLTAGHVDISLWYVIAGNRGQQIQYDRSEFRRVRWFHKNEVPFDRSDPNMRRFLKKFYADKAAIAS